MDCSVFAKEVHVISKMQKCLLTELRCTWHCFPGYRCITTYGMHNPPWQILLAGYLRVFKTQITKPRTKTFHLRQLKLSRPSRRSTLFLLRTCRGKSSNKLCSQWSGHATINDCQLPLTSINQRCWTKSREIEVTVDQRGCSSAQGSNLISFRLRAEIMGRTSSQASIACLAPFPVPVPVT